MLVLLCWCVCFRRVFHRRHAAPVKVENCHRLPVLTREK